MKMDDIKNLSSDHKLLLEHVGVTDVSVLALADESHLHREAVESAAKLGQPAPSVVTVRNWIQDARSLRASRSGGSSAAPEEEVGEVLEAISLDDVPEVLIEGKAPLPMGKKTIPDITGAPPVSLPQKRKDPAQNRGAVPLVPNPGGGIAPQLPPILRSDERRQTPMERAMHDIGAATQREKTILPEPRRESAEPEKKRFQSLAEYQEGARGIAPLPRKENPMAPALADDARKADGSLSRSTKRGVVYPHPAQAVFGALISLAWRMAVIASLVGLPWLVLNQPEGAPPPLKQALPWIGGLLVLGIMQLVIIDRVRCRICTCHLFYSKRCTKNSRAHKSIFGYVATLCLHMLTFQWFRCMYCGTSIRLGGSKAEKAEAAATPPSKTPESEA